ncbi:MAG: hypothetical protein PVI72_06050 [Desulfobacterales bacterium]|jgi:hypothetical protein
MRRYTGVRAATISVERGFVSGGEGFNVSEGSNGVTIDKGKVSFFSY